MTRDEILSRLTDLGFDPYTEAVKSFQRSRGLKDDGLVGPITTKALQADAAPSGGEMKVSAKGRKLLSEREGVRLKAYQDSVNIWTIGVGHTSAAGAPHVAPGMAITAAECDEILSRDLAKFEKTVLDAVNVSLAQHEFDALVSFAFNVGGGAFAGSTLLKMLNAGDRKGAADEFRDWTKAGGKKLQGLVNRREGERAQFLGL